MSHTFAIPQANCKLAAAVESLYISAMIGLALKEAKALGIDRVLMCCDKENIGSAKSIMNNGGVLENEVIVNGVTEQRYWIEC